MADKSNELVHNMPLTSRVKLTFSRTSMSYDKKKKRTTFVYTLDQWNGSNDAPTFDVVIDDWKGSEPANRGALSRATRAALEEGISEVLITQLDI